MNRRNTEFYQQYLEAEEFNESLKNERFCQTLSELYQQLKGQIKKIEYKESKAIEAELFSEFCRKHEYNTKEAREIFDKLLLPTADNLISSLKTHPQAIYTSRLLDFKNLPEPQNSQEINEQFYSRSNRTNQDSDQINLRIPSTGISSKPNQLNIKKEQMKQTSQPKEISDKLAGISLEDKKTTSSGLTSEINKLEVRSKRQLSLDSQAKTNQGEPKQSKTIEISECQAKLMEIDKAELVISTGITKDLNQLELSTQTNLTNIHPSFTPQLIQS
jgi:hypothetical protein